MREKVREVKLPLTMGLDCMEAKPLIANADLLWVMPCRPACHSRRHVKLEKPLSPTGKGERHVIGTEGFLGRGERGEKNRPFWQETKDEWNFVTTEIGDCQISECR